MTSISSFGSSLITLQFSLDLSIDVAEQEVQAAINAATTLLPQNLPVPPVYSKTNPADAPILTLALTSTTVPLPKVEELAETRMAQRISQLQGVGLVSISGGQRPAVRVQANPTALASYGLSLETLRTALTQRQRESGQGQLRRPAIRRGRSTTTISCRRARSTARSSSPTATARRCACADVATVVDGVENSKLAAWVNDDPAIVLNIQRQPGTNIISVVDTVQALLPQIEASLPEGINVRGHQRPDDDHPGIGEGRRIRAAAHHRSGGGWSSFCSCAARRPRSFPASPCRCRWSARSPSCICSATASTTSR